MSRKVFLSVLGTGFYEPCPYKIGDFISEKTRFIQLATIDYLKVKEWSTNDAFIILLTDKAKETNWNKQKDNMREGKEYVSLQVLLDEKELPMSPTIVNIPDGKNEDEMWTIFQRLYDHIQEDDELFIDLTHSFRYIPMMMMVFSNYAKFLKGVKVNSVTYGNYEDLKNNLSETGFIVDITSLSKLQDWTAGADEFLSSGKVDKLKNNYIPQLNKRNKESGYLDRNAQQQIRMVENLEKVVKDLMVCRGIEIVKGSNFNNLHKCIQKIMDEDMPEPFKPLFRKISSSFIDFEDREDIQNGIKAARWCYDHQLYQQSITLLRESIDTLTCISVRKECPEVNYKDEDWRECATIAYHNISNKQKAIEGRYPIDSNSKKAIKCATNEEAETIKSQCKKKYIPVIEKMMELNFLTSLDMDKLDSFKNLRNDINHCGMRNCPMKVETIKNNTKDFLDYLENKVKEILS